MVIIHEMYNYRSLGSIHRNEIIVKTCNYQMLIERATGWLHWNDMVITTYEIQQIHVIFYWVSAYKPRCYQYVILRPMHICMLQVSR